MAVDRALAVDAGVLAVPPRGPQGFDKPGQSREMSNGIASATAAWLTGASAWSPRTCRSSAAWCASSAWRATAACSSPGSSRAARRSRAGLREGDLLVAAEGRELPDVDALHRLLTEHEVGRPLTVTVIRRTQRREFSVTPVEAAA